MCKCGGSGTHEPHNGTLDPDGTQTALRFRYHDQAGCHQKFSAFAFNSPLKDLVEESSECHMEGAWWCDLVDIQWVTAVVPYGTKLCARPPRVSCRRVLVLQRVESGAHLVRGELEALFHWWIVCTRREQVPLVGNWMQSRNPLCHELG